MDACFSPSIAAMFVHFWVVGAVFITPLWALPTGLLAIICLTVSFMFDRCSLSFVKSVGEYGRLRPNGYSDINIEHFRMKYQRIVQLVELVDENFSFFILATYMMYLAGTCISIYRVVFIDSVGVMEYVWVSPVLLLLGMMTLLSAKVNTSVSIFWLINVILGITKIHFVGARFIIII